MPNACVEFGHPTRCGWVHFKLCFSFYCCILKLCTFPNKANEPGQKQSDRDKRRDRVKGKATETSEGTRAKRPRQAKGLGQSDRDKRRHLAKATSVMSKCPYTGTSLKDVQKLAYTDDYGFSMVEGMLWLENNACPLTGKRIDMGRIYGEQDLIICIDVSYSMEMDAITESMNRTSDREQLMNAKMMRMIDIVRHMTVLLLENLDDKFTVTIISFSSACSVIFERQLLTRKTLNTMKQKMKNMRPDGATNWQSPLTEAIMLSSQNPNVKTSILMFSDGVPNRSCETMVDSIREALDNHQGNISFNALLYGSEVFAGVKYLQDISKIFTEHASRVRQADNYRVNMGGIIYLPTPASLFDPAQSVMPYFIAMLKSENSLCLSSLKMLRQNLNTEYIDLLAEIVDTCVPKIYYDGRAYVPAHLKDSANVLVMNSKIDLDPQLREALSVQNIQTWGLPAIATLISQHSIGFTANPFDASAQKFVESIPNTAELMKNVRISISSYETGEIR